MKTLFLVIALSSLIFVSASTPIKGVKHHHYTTYYNADKREPDSVSWDLTSDMLCDRKPPRVAFTADPQVAGCPGAGAYDEPLNGVKYSQGHMFNFDEAKCDETDRKECFFMSNMLPQAQSFNAGDWASVEHQERRWAAAGKVHIVAGGIGSIGRLANSNVNVPDSCWKAIYHDHQWDGYIMANRPDSHGHHLASHIARFDDFERRT